MLDTNVIVSGVFWRGSPQRLLSGAYRDGIQNFTSEWMLTELMRVLSADKFIPKFWESGRTVNLVVDALVRRSALDTSAEINPSPPMMIGSSPPPSRQRPI